MQRQTAESIRELKAQLEGLPRPFVVVGVGVPASGKTTCLGVLAEKLQVLYLSSDAVRKELSGSESDQAVNEPAWSLVYQRAYDTLSRGGSIVIDATHCNFETRVRDVANYRSKGARSVAAVFFDTPLEVALVHNAQRSRVVSEKIIRGMYKDVQANPPSQADGFDQVARISPERGFEWTIPLAK